MYLWCPLCWGWMRKFAELVCSVLSSTLPTQRTTIATCLSDFSQLQDLKPYTSSWLLKTHQYIVWSNTENILTWQPRKRGTSTRQQHKHCHQTIQELTSQFSFSFLKQVRAQSQHRPTYDNQRGIMAHNSGNSKFPASLGVWEQIKLKRFESSSIFLVKQPILLPKLVRDSLISL